MPNRNQLTILTTAQADAIRALGDGQAVAEIVKIYWPAPDGMKAYSWWDLRNDPLYSGSSLSTFLGGAPLITAFVAEDAEKADCFYEIHRLSAVGDDVVRMRFANRDRQFETLAYKHRGGVKVEIFYFLPQVSGGLAVSWFLGHLRTPDRAD